MTKVRDLVATAIDAFAAAGIDGARNDALVLLSAATGISRALLIADPDRLIDGAAADIFRAYSARRAQREPVSHILAEREFWSLPFKVTAATLAPRPDSETVVEAALSQVADRGAPVRLLDLGVGSGCLLAALLHELPNATGVGVDVSAAAADVARENLQRLGLDARAGIVVADWATGFADDAFFDLVVSNPPYIASGAELPPEVVRYEPASALFAGVDGLDAYRSLLPVAHRHLIAGGILVLELGAGQRAAVAALAQDAGFQIINCCRDLAGMERALILKKEA